MSLWLHELGAQVHGFALNPPTDPNFFEVAGIAACLSSETRADLADLGQLRDTINRVRPQTIFHLAAQSLVRVSYADPITTFNTNVLGTAHVLEAARSAQCVESIVIVTTDKVYENHGLQQPYRESDSLGGHDPYSASKAAAEIVVASYRASFFGTPHGPLIATARAGNVVGGGDWSLDRLVPDAYRAFTTEQPLRLRYPHAVRPWQHVLESLAGYLVLGRLLAGPTGRQFATAWNFGPGQGADATVLDVAQRLARIWGEAAHVESVISGDHPHEAAALKLDSSKASRHLGWYPRWTLEETLNQTAEWYQAYLSGARMKEFSIRQLEQYLAARPLQICAST